MEPRDFKSLLRSTVILPGVLLLFLALVLIWNVFYTQDRLRDLEHARQVVAATRQFFRVSVDMETGLRGYILTGDRRLLEPYKKAESEMPQRVADLQRLTSNDPSGREFFEDLSTSFNEWKTFSDELVNQAWNPKEATSIPLLLEEQRLMRSIRVARDALLNKVDHDQSQTFEWLHQAARNLAIVVGVLSFLAVLIAWTTHRRMSALINTYAKHINLEQRRTAEAQEAREWLLTTLESIAEAVIATDADGRIQFMNASAEHLTGWKAREARNSPLQDVLALINKHTEQQVESPVERVLATRMSTNISGEILLRRRDNQYAHVSDSASPILNSRNELIGVVLVLRDVTELRRSEAVLRSSERLALIGRLSATIAHEIRNPLDAVTGLLYLVHQAENLDNNSRALVKTAQEELERITQITNQLLSFSREARAPVAIDVSELLDSVLGLFSPKLTAAGILVQRDFWSHDTITGLPGELRQVFSNLVANAIDVLPRGGHLQVRIRQSPNWMEKAGVIVSVADDGPGIPSDARASLFTPFFTTKGERGTGLGLWVSHGIVVKHGGEIKMRSRTGVRHGTIFSVFLPLRTAEASKAETAA